MKNKTITNTVRTLLTAAAILAAPAITSTALRAQNTPITYNYTYDANGNLTHDGRTGLEMKWNVLNLLDSAGVHGSSLTYTWLSDGTLIGSTQDDGKGNIIKRHYLGSFVFVEDPVSGEWVRESIGWDEGRIFFDVPFLADSTEVVVDSTVADRGYRDCWYARDHLGNVRAVIDITPGLPAPVVLEQSDYLPFGTRISNAAHASMPSNRWRYAGKEEQRSGSLDLGLLNFGARMYDPFTARWTAVDPMAGKYGQMSPYSYCGGNPVGLFDDGGLDLVIAGKNNSSVTFKTNLLEKEISVASLGIDWNGNHTLEGDAVLSAGLDIVGIVDPSGAADLANAALQYRNGEYLGAALSAVGLIPYAGDLVKAGRVGKDVNVISSTVDAFKAGKDLTTKSFRSFTARNFRENLVRLTGDNPAGKDAHHLLPKAFAKQLGNKGINVNDPKYGRWVNRQAHNKTAHRYNQDFRKYLSDNPNATEEQIVEYANTLMKQYELY